MTLKNDTPKRSVCESTWHIADRAAVSEWLNFSIVSSSCLIKASLADAYTTWADKATHAASLTLGSPEDGLF